MTVRGERVERSVLPAVSVCVLTSRRHELLERCLASLTAQQDPPPYELLVCADRDPEALDMVGALFPEAVLCTSAGRFVGASRNPLIERASGELLLFVDDDVILHPELLARLGALSVAHPDCMVFGGPNKTPPGSSRFQMVQGAVLSSIVGSGPVRKRYGPHPAGPADERSFILCNLAIRRRAMVPFAEELSGAEENALLAELHRQRMAMHYDPDLVVFHERRATLRGFADQMFKYGRGRGELIMRNPGTLRPAHLAPVALLAYLVALAVATVAGVASAIWALPLVVYASAVLAGSLKIALGIGGSVPLAGVLILVLHIEYGAGIIAGMVVSRRRRRVAAQVAATRLTS